MSSPQVVDLEAELFEPTAVGIAVASDTWARPLRPRRDQRHLDQKVWIAPRSSPVSTNRPHSPDSRALGPDRAPLTFPYASACVRSTGTNFRVLWRRATSVELHRVGGVHSTTVGRPHFGVPCRIWTLLGSVCPHSLCCQRGCDIPRILRLLGAASCSEVCTRVIRVQNKILPSSRCRVNIMRVLHVRIRLIC